ncbi:T9SS type A sorting domain-containing protein [Aequorivita xiaoshiensis]|uniref:T9SS type A sorting domain-containing protein n=1 Tax=Aequorivita xiaoshiensis TaxID=2874476 RepID=A0A9X1R4Z6_9FLAO|nr:T9SS type A sorting domain-containing protein [Aequorivita xiaoshiensis]MCG2431633.1 T9SS type A sorting domain-containing protein [Aequorivita xiaoshiensis]
MRSFYTIITLFLFTPFFSLLAQGSQDGSQVVHIYEETAISIPPMPEFSPSISHLNSGDLVEGDTFGQFKFSPDGTQIWTVNRSTNNVTVIDVDSRDIIQNIEVGEFPFGIDFSDEYALVTCSLSNEVYVINISDFSVQTIIPVSSYPAPVEISRVGNIAIVGCDTDDVAEVINLNTLTVINTISNFPVAIHLNSTASGHNRKVNSYRNFKITDDEEFVVNGASSDGLKFFDIDTGAVTATIVEAKDTRQLALSGDGTKIVGYETMDDVVTQVDVATQSFTKQVSIPQGVSFTFGPAAINMDGSKALVATSQNSSALIDFETETFDFINLNNRPNWLASTNNGETFVAGGSILSTIDSNTGTILGTLSNEQIQLGAISANGTVAASTPLFFEWINFYDLSTPSQITKEGKQFTGSELEADVPSLVKFTPDGSKIITANSLSGSVSIIDVETETLESIIDLNTYSVASLDITSDGNYAVVPDRINDEVVIIDLQTAEIVATVSSGGSGPNQVFILPGDDIAYVSNVAGVGGVDNIGVISLDGTNSSLISTFSTGKASLYFYNYYVLHGSFEITQDGQYGLLAAGSSNEINIIDLNSHTIVNTISVAEYPLHISITKNSSLGEFAAVTLKYSDEIAILEKSDGIWSLLNKYSSAAGPTRIEYDPHSESFWVTSREDQVIQRFSISDLEFVEDINYAPSDPIAVRVAKDFNRKFTITNQRFSNGENMLEVNTSGSLEEYSLPTLASHYFDISSDGKMAAIGQFNIDQVSLFKDTELGVQQITINNTLNPYTVYPNPVDDHINFKNTYGKLPNGNIEFFLYDSLGKLVSKSQVEGKSLFSIPRSQTLKGGLYTYKLKNSSQIIQNGKLILK